MTLRWKIYEGHPYQDPQGFYLTPRRTFLDDPLLYHSNGKPRAPFHEWMAWQWLVWASVYEVGGRDIYRDGITLHLARGQCVYSLEFLMAAWGWGSKSRVSRFLSMLQAEGRIRLDWPTVRALATPSEPSTARVNTKQGKMTKREHYTQRRVQRLGRLITLLNYDTYQSLAFYYATPPGEVALLTRDGRATNSKEVKEVKKRKYRARRNPRVIHTVDKPVDNPATPITWNAIRGTVRLGVWPNMPAHIQQAQITEALSLDPAVPEDLSFLINGHHRPDVDRASQLRQVRARLKGE